MLKSGVGGSQDIAAALKAFEKAAAFGHPLAEYELGLIKRSAGQGG